MFTPQGVSKGGRRWRRKMYQDGSVSKKLSGTLITIGTLAIVGLIILLTGFRQVDAGEVAVVTRFGKVTDRVLEPGAHVITPFVNGTTYYNTKKVIYETTTEDKQKGSDADYKDYPVDTNTSDGQQVDIFYTIRFSIDQTKANFIAQNIGSEEALVDKIVKTESRIWIRNIPREYTAERLYTGDGVIDMQTSIEEKLRPTFEANGLVLDSVGIREIKFSEDYVSAIEYKQIEAVKVETATNIALRAEQEKQATIRQAEAQAEAQRLQATTLTPQYIEIEWIKKWRGDVPTYVAGESGNFLFQLPK